jgi:hypothetical protein
LASLTITNCTLHIQQLKTAAEVDLSGMELKVEDAIVVASCIQVQNHSSLYAFTHSD